ncbi:Xaa-Pro aminopeptidase [Nematocida sp. AWRm80]|nr:Xaa-Pro aminopeptidase [Nematocida sp. AWRm80]
MSKIEELREEMERLEMDGCLVYRRDIHLNEYIHEKYEQVKYLSGFSGSNGVLVVFKDKVYLYTDSRYYIQAKNEMPAEIILGKMEEDITIEERILEESKTKEGMFRVGISSEYITEKQYLNMIKRLENSKVEIVLTREDIIDKVWKDRPEIHPSTLDIMGDQVQTGIGNGNREEKEDKEPNPLVEVKTRIEKIRQMMGLVKSQDQSKPLFLSQPPIQDKLDRVFITDMDEIAWITGLRGKDIPMSRLFYAFMEIAEQEIILYTDSILPVDYMNRSGINLTLKKYKEFYQSIEQVSDKTVGITNSTNSYIHKLLKQKNRVKEFSGILDLKAIKTPKEIEGFKEANAKDGVYLCKLFGEIKSILDSNKEIGELEASDLLEKLKQEDKDFICPSFDTISSFGPNGAIIHYKPENNEVKIAKDNLYLLDSGSQYRRGTTDITRTVCFGDPTPGQISHYTAVIKGCTQLEMTRFKKNIPLGALAVIVRAPIWSIGLDYAHATGHGVGYGLNVHEGPHTLEMRSIIKATEGMVVTNEPGIYIEGSHGIRHENLMLVTEDKENKNFLRLENITPVPLHLALLDPSKLSTEEIDHINKYSEYIRDILAPSLQSAPEGLKWMEENTKKIYK